MVRHAPCDLITVKLTGDRPIGKILLPTAGGPHANLAAEYVAILQRSLDVEVTCCYVVKKARTERDELLAYEWIDKTIHNSGFAGGVGRRLIESDSIAPGLVKAASEYDLLVLGASKEGIFSSVLFGEIPEKVARYSKQPVMIVKRYEGIVKSLIKKAFG